MTVVNLGSNYTVGDRIQFSGTFSGPSPVDDVEAKILPPNSPSVALTAVLTGQTWVASYTPVVSGTFQITVQGMIASEPVKTVQGQFAVNAIRAA